MTSFILLQIINLYLVQPFYFKNFHPIWRIILIKTLAKCIIFHTFSIPMILTRLFYLILIKVLTLRWKYHKRIYSWNLYILHWTFQFLHHNQCQTLKHDKGAFLMCPIFLYDTSSQKRPTCICKLPYSNYFDKLCKQIIFSMLKLL